MLKVEVNHVRGGHGVVGVEGLYIAYFLFDARAVAKIYLLLMDEAPPRAGSISLGN